jgi:TetR/AcrR family fatty acid metabolism transcriptional regulator
MKIDKKTKVLEAATKVFAEKGYHYAKISEIVDESGYSTGLIYSYFLNKLDILLSVVLSFLKRINQLNDDTLYNLANPLDKLTTIVSNVESLCNQGDNLCLMKVLNEVLPLVNATTEEKLLPKRNEIFIENRMFLKTIDEVIMDGQKKEIFDTAFNCSTVRQVLGGGIRVLMNGLFYQKYCNEEIGYNEDDAHKTLLGLIKKFIKK